MNPSSALTLAGGLLGYPEEMILPYDDDDDDGAGFSVTTVRAFTKCPSQRIFHYLGFAGESLATT